MKIQSIYIKNLQAIDDLSLTPGAAFVAVAGQNGSGKTSIIDALRMAWLGAARVPLKKQWPELVAAGAKSGEICIETDAGITKLTLPSGARTGGIDLTPQASAALPFALAPSTIAGLTGDDLRRLLLTINPQAGNSPRQELLARGKIADGIADGMSFEEAHGFAKQALQHAKADWKAHTGQAYGAKQSPNWKPESPEAVSEDAMAAAEADLAAATDTATSAQGKLAIVENTLRQQLSQQERRNQLEAEGANKLAGMRSALATDEADLAALLAKRKRYGLVHSLAWALRQWHMRCDEPELNELASRALDEYCAAYGQPEEPGQPDAELESAIAKLEGIINKTKSNITRAEAAASALADMAKSAEPALAESDYVAAMQAVTQARNAEQAARKALGGLKAQDELHHNAKARAEKAASILAEIDAWASTVDELSPGGIPAKLAKAAADAVNARLRANAIHTEWAQVHIGDDMEITMGGRAYQLRSESEKWRADAMLAEAISFVSGLGFIALDGFDVLDGAGRSQLIGWLVTLAENCECGGVVNATIPAERREGFMALPPAAIKTVWLE